MEKYRKKPVVIEAVQWFKHGDHIAVEKYSQNTIDRHPAYDCCGFITTPEGIMNVIPKDWIITGVKGELYPVKDEIFKETYEPVSEGRTERNDN